MADSFRRLILFSFALLLTVVVIGCGGQLPSSGAKVLHVWYSTDDPAERVWSQYLARRYEETHPGVTVDLADYNFAELNTKLQLALATGSAPDLAYVTPRGPGIPAYVRAHKLLDISAAAVRYRWAARLRPGLLQRYNQPFTLLGTRGPKVAAVPMALAEVGIMYNRHILQRLNLSVPRSTAAFESALAKGYHAGYVPLGMGNADGWLGDDWYLALVNAAVPSGVLAAEQVRNPHFSFLGTPYIGAARSLQRWAKNGYFTQDFGGLDAQEGIDEFFKGKTIFQLISSSEDSQIRRDEQRTHMSIGVFAFPDFRGAGVMPGSGYLGWVVPATSRHPDAAEQFIDSVLSGSTGRFLLRQGVLPAGRVANTELKDLPSWQREFVAALNSARPGIYLDAAPVANLNATMEANVQLLLQGYEAPNFLVNALEKVYAHGQGGSTARIDGEF